MVIINLLDMLNILVTMLKEHIVEIQNHKLKNEVTDTDISYIINKE